MTDRPSLPVIWSARAIHDLAAIRAYIGEFAPLAAQRLTARLVATGENLAEHPNRGRPISRGVRELVAVRPYLVLYKITAEGVHIVHIKHRAQRPE